MKIKGILTACFLLLLSVMLTGCIVPQETETPEPTQTVIPQGEEFHHAELNGEISITKYTGTEAEVIIPSHINGMPVTSIGKYCFTESEVKITSLYIPATVRSLGEYMCNGVDTLIELNFEDASTIESIGVNAFKDTAVEISAKGSGEGIFSIGKFVVSVRQINDAAVMIPERLTAVAPGAFADVTAPMLVFHEGFKYIDPAEIYASSVASVKIEATDAEFADTPMFKDILSYMVCRPASTAVEYAVENCILYDVDSDENVWDYEIIDGYAVIKSYKGTSLNVKIPNTLGNYPVREVGDGGYFFGESAPHMVYISANVERINSNFANGAADLVHVYFGNEKSIKYLGADIFKDTPFENEGNRKDNMSVIAGILTRHFGKGDIILPETITGVAANSFGKNVNTITLNEGCVWVADGFLATCEELEWVYLPNSLTDLRLSMFGDAESLSRIVIKCDMVSYAAQFAKNNALRCELICYWDYILSDSDMTATLVQYTGNQKNVIVPDKIGEHTVTQILSIRNSNIARISVPATVTVLGDMFAYSVRSLEFIDFKDSSRLEYIGKQAFYNTLYEELYRDDNKLLIMNNILVSFTGEGAVVVPDGVKEIAPMAFYKTAVTEIQLPGSCIKIGENAFASCTELMSVYIPDNVTDIGLFAFDNSDNAVINCHLNSYAESYAKQNGYRYQKAEYADWGYSIINETIRIESYKGKETEVIIPSVLHGYPVTAIDAFAFTKTLITSVFVPKTVSTIGSYAFNGVSTLETVIFEDESTIESIGDMAFSQTIFFSTLEMENNVYTINDILIKSNAEGDFVLPYYIKHIAGGSFDGCNVTSVTVNESCASIGENAFSNLMNIAYIYIPDGVTRLTGDIILSCNDSLELRCHASSAAKIYAEDKGLNLALLSNSFKYSVITEGETEYAILTEYLGSSAYVQIPVLIDGIVPIEIGARCFTKTNVETLYIPENIKRLGSNLARSVLKSVIFENEYGIEHIARGAFAGTAFEEEHLRSDNGVLIIGNILTAADLAGEAELPSGITVIAGGAFKGDGELLNITIQDGCLRIDGEAFAGIDTLVWVYIPDSVEIIGEGILNGTNAHIMCNAGSHAEQYAIKYGIEYVLVNTDYDWMYSVENGEIVLQKYIGDPNDVVIPSVIGGTPVTKIGKGCFAFSGVTSVYIPSSIKSIDADAFLGTVQLESIEFEDTLSIEFIGKDAFKDTVVIEAYKTENGLSVLNGILFAANASGDLVLGENIKAIAGGAFAGNNKLSSVTLSASCTFIGEAAFASLEQMLEIRIPSSVTSIDDTAFMGSPNVKLMVNDKSFAHTYAVQHGIAYELEADEFLYEIVDGNAVIIEYTGKAVDVVIPSSVASYKVTALGDECFAYSRIKSVWIPASVTKIGDRCFYGVITLETVTFEDETKLEFIGNQAFTDTMWENFTAVDVNSMVIVNGILLRHFGSGVVELDESVRVIAGGAFYDRQNITSIVIGDSCTEIQSNAFDSMNKLELISIPNSVLTIDDGAIQRCNSELYVVCSADSEAYKYVTRNNIKCVIVD